MKKTPPVFIFVGHSGSGKTTLVEKLLPELTARGLQLATIKHAHHKVVLDKEGKDSWRYKQAGAVMSMLVTTNELQLVADDVGAIAFDAVFVGVFFGTQLAFNVNRLAFT